MHSALACQVSGFIIVTPGLVQAPGIKQGICRAGIKAYHRFAASGRKPGDIGNSSKIQNAAILLVRGKQPLMEGRNQWGALTTSGQVSAAKIRDRGQPGAFRNTGGIANLK